MPVRAFANGGARGEVRESCRAYLASENGILQQNIGYVTVNHGGPNGEVQARFQRFRVQVLQGYVACGTLPRFHGSGGSRSV